MKAAARQLEFERAAALRDEIQQIRLRVLEQDQSVIVGRAAERAAAEAKRSNGRPRRPGERVEPERPKIEVTSITVLPSGEEPSEALDGVPADLNGEGEGDGRSGATASDWLPGIRDEHEGDDAGWQSRWLDRQTWDRTVTPNVIRRTGTRPQRSGRRRG